MTLKKRKSVCNSSYKDMLGSGLASSLFLNVTTIQKYVRKSHALASNSINTWGGQRPEMEGGNLTQQEILRGERWSRGGFNLVFGPINPPSCAVAPPSNPKDRTSLIRAAYILEHGY
ncbi:hypothetical protein Peur_030117 [Populus x canadensis]